MARILYGTQAPAVVELLLMADNPDASRSERYAAEMALEWFDPSAILPARPSDLEEPKAVTLLRTALLDGTMAVRIAAGDQLAALLAPATIGGR